MAPMWMPSGAWRMPSRPGTRLISTTCSGAARRSFMSGIRLMPPASTLALPSDSSARASCKVVGEGYSNSWGIILASVLNQVPNLFGSARHIDVPHAQVAERIHHRIDDGGRRSNGAGLAHAFHTQRIHGRGRTRVGALDPWNHAGLGDGVIHQLTGDELAVVVVDGLFVEGLSEALHDAAVDLSIDQQRVDDVAAIVHGHIAQNLDLAGI